MIYSIQEMAFVIEHLLMVSAIPYRYCRNLLNHFQNFYSRWIDFKRQFQVPAISGEWISSMLKYFMYAQRHHMAIFLLKTPKEDLDHELKTSSNKSAPAKWLNYAEDFSILLSWIIIYEASLMTHQPILST